MEKTNKAAEERLDFAQLALAEDELQEAKAKHGLTEPEKWWQKLGDRFFAARENRELHLVNRRVYLWLAILTGWLGGHRFYERRWRMGAMYLAFCWTGVPIAMSVVDWMIAFPKAADESGRILL